MTKTTSSAMNWIFLILLVVPILPFAAFGATISPVTGSSAGAGPTTPIFFPSSTGPVNGTQVATVSGTDNIGGSFVEQEVWSLDLVDGPTGSCTISGSPGERFNLIEAAAVRTYATGDQLYLLAFGAANGNYCVKNLPCGTIPTPSEFIIHYSAAGGTGAFSQASGSLTQSAQLAGLALPGECVDNQFTGGAFVTYSETITGGSISP